MTDTDIVASKPDISAVNLDGVGLVAAHMSRLERFGGLAPMAASTDAAAAGIAIRSTKVKTALSIAFEDASTEGLSGDDMQVLEEVGARIDALLDLTEVMVAHSEGTMPPFDEIAFAGAVAGQDTQALSLTARVATGDVTGLTRSDIASVARPVVALASAPMLIPQINALMITSWQIMANAGVVSGDIVGKLSGQLGGIDDRVQGGDGPFFTSIEEGSSCKTATVTRDQKFAQGVRQDRRLRITLKRVTGGEPGIKVQVRLVDGTLVRELTDEGKGVELDGLQGPKSFVFNLVTKDPNAVATLEVCVIR